ncbi:MAG: hypothetical protein ACT4P2_17140 [Pseudomonadota bacterium]
MRLADVASITPGVPFRSRIENEAEGSVAVVQARDLSAEGLINVAGAARVRNIPRATKTELRHGDVVLQPRGARFPVGLFEGSDRPAVAAAPLLVIRCDQTRIAPEFLLVLLRLPSAQAFLRQSAVGTYVPQVPRQAIEDIFIQLPDLPSQMRLVDLARLERREVELMDRLREQRERLFEIATRELAKKSRKRANAPGFNPDPNDASTPWGPLSKTT